jgi:hypothetical protein
MVPIASLWIPILVSAVAVFVASSIIHMVLGYHHGDFRGVPGEDDFMDAVRKFDIPSGDYCFPRPQSSKDLRNPAFMEKMKRGPVGLMTVRPSGPPAMGKSLVLWFLYCVVVSGIAAYVAGRALSAGAGMRPVLRFAGVTAFACYVVGLWQFTIWYWRSMSTTLKSTLDGLIYAVVTGLVFGWLWPR